MSTKLLEQFGDNTDKAVSVLSDRLTRLNSQLAGLVGAKVTLPSSLQGIGSSSSSTQTVYGNATDIANAKAAAIAQGKSGNFNFVTIVNGDASVAKAGDVVLGGTAAIKNTGSGNRVAGYTANDTLNQFKTIAGFGTGGETPAWGSGSKFLLAHEKERILSSAQTVSFNKLIDMLPKLNILSDLRNFSIPKMPQFAPSLAGIGGINSGETFNINGNISVVANNPRELINQLRNISAVKK
jgi:hypothetical protein